MTDRDAPATDPEEAETEWTSPWPFALLVFGLPLTLILVCGGVDFVALLGL